MVTMTQVELNGEVLPHYDGLNQLVRGIYDGRYSVSEFCTQLHNVYDMQVESMNTDSDGILRMSVTVSVSVNGGYSYNRFNGTIVCLQSEEM